MDRKRIEELAFKAVRSGNYTYTDFMGQGDLASFLDYADTLGVPYTVCGGYPESERAVICFGSVEMCGYSEDPPIRLVEIRSRGKKFAEELTHRDYLGALMNLGITREMLGDIIISDNIAYVFVAEHMAGYITDSLMNVKHTAVDCCLTEELPEGLGSKKEERQLIVSSNRLDSIIARVFNLSREQAGDCIREGRVFVNGRTAVKKEKSLAEGDRVSVRGKGKFIFSTENGKTKKDRLSITILLYI
ncbi:MAG: hypothetical protein K6C35_05710 [Eubacterium sp.]|nr:hypothetical protein [Eubacterium sp.]